MCNIIKRLLDYPRDVEQSISWAKLPEIPLCHTSRPDRHFASVAEVLGYVRPLVDKYAVMVYLSVTL
ncbi:hypothetical protein [Methylotuvimicrobium sp. KM2]|uniref:hypothetical protein n=1 Tax=Methylotuvimicrobium sp. KM2 TaxID=3133976 RepID=UPI00310152F3